ncbi:MAG TPA: molecular chaperone TorD family protein [Thermodesulfobacteriota bacterium]|nr:molecular chaperone TorD family protein [Thermodesulfobacteriota bacterium]
MSLYQRLAKVIDYPGSDLFQRVDECISLLPPHHEEATGLLKEFRASLGRIPLGTIEELYARTFDPQAASYPYVGYQLLGDGNHRGMFLAGLKEHYQIYDFSSGNELPDHLGVMLRFLARDDDKEEREELLSLCILPALRKMVHGFSDDGNPYRKLLKAILLLLGEGDEAMTNVNHRVTRMTGPEEFCDGR